jgi:hypothetical protein
VSGGEISDAHLSLLQRFFDLISLLAQQGLGPYRSQLRLQLGSLAFPQRLFVFRGTQLELDLLQIRL